MKPDFAELFDLIFTKGNAGDARLDLMSRVAVNVRMYW